MFCMENKNLGTAIVDQTRDPSSPIYYLLQWSIPDASEKDARIIAAGITSP